MGRAAVLAVIAVLVGCAGDDPGTSLRLTAKNSSVGAAVFTLECDPPGGSIPDPAAACAALTKRPGLLLQPQPFTCWGGTFSWWDITISGAFDGDAVDVKTSTCWTPQMELIRVLGIAPELERHIDPLSRPAYPGSGIPRSELAQTVEIAAPAPGWLVRVARLYARGLGDEKPDLLRITLGATYVVELEGAFVCDICPRPAGEPSPRGTVARLKVDPKTHRVDDFSLSPK